MTQKLMYQLPELPKELKQNKPLEKSELDNLIENYTNKVFITFLVDNDKNINHKKDTEARTQTVQGIDNIMRLIDKNLNPKDSKKTTLYGKALKNDCKILKDRFKKLKEYITQEQTNQKDTTYNFRTLIDIWNRISEDIKKENTTKEQENDTKTSDSQNNQEANNQSEQSNNDTKSSKNTEKENNKPYESEAQFKAALENHFNENIGKIENIKLYIDEKNDQNKDQKDDKGWELINITDNDKKKRYLKKIDSNTQMLIRSFDDLFGNKIGKIKIFNDPNSTNNDGDENQNKNQILEEIRQQYDSIMKHKPQKSEDKNTTVSQEIGYPNGTHLPAVLPNTSVALIDEKTNTPTEKINTETNIADSGEKQESITETAEEKVEKITEETAQKIFENFSIDVHIMDKEALMTEAERNKVRTQHAQEYQKAKFFKKMKMFLLDRSKQRKEVNQAIADAKEQNTFIESDNSQARIDGMIGTYAQMASMGLGSKIMDERVDLGTNDKIDEIAHKYIMGSMSKDDAIKAFNQEFAQIYKANQNNIQTLGAMTGTDIMAQIDNAAFKEHYREMHNTEAHNKAINAINTKTEKITIKLRGLHKKENAADLEGTSYEAYDKGVNKFLSQVGDKIQKTTGLSKGAQHIIAKIGSGVGLGLALGPRGWLAAGAVGATMQYMKTKRDSIKEISKTHEDAINMGSAELTAQLSEVIKQLDEAQKNAGTIKKIGTRMGWTNINRLQKQKKIYEAFHRIHTTPSEDASKSLLRPVGDIIADLQKAKSPTMSQEERRKIIAQTLARINTGHTLNTQLISTVDHQGISLGREQTAIQRQEMLKLLNEVAFEDFKASKFPAYNKNSEGYFFEEGDAQSTINFKKSKANPKDRSHYWNSIITSNDEYKELTAHLTNEYEVLQSTINDTRTDLARQATGHYAKNALGIAALGGALHGIHGIASGFSGGTIPGEAVTHDFSFTDSTNFGVNQHEYLAQSSNFANIPDGSLIPSAQIDVGVDAMNVRAHSGFANYMDKINEVSNTISQSNLHSETKQALQNALSEDKIRELMSYAADQKADLGNQKLFAMRWTEAIDHLTRQLNDNNLTNVQIGTVEFNHNLNGLIDAYPSLPRNPGNIAHRGFEILLNGQNTITGAPITLPYTWLRERPWFNTLGGTSTLLPYFNTYAYSINKKKEKNTNPDTIKADPDSPNATTFKDPVTNDKSQTSIEFHAESPANIVSDQSSLKDRGILDQGDANKSEEAAIPTKENQAEILPEHKAIGVSSTPDQTITSPTRTLSDSAKTEGKMNEKTSKPADIDINIEDINIEDINIENLNSSIPGINNSLQTINKKIEEFKALKKQGTVNDISILQKTIEEKLQRIDAVIGTYKNNTNENIKHISDLARKEFINKQDKKRPIKTSTPNFWSKLFLSKEKETGSRPHENITGQLKEQNENKKLNAMNPTIIIPLEEGDDIASIMETINSRKGEQNIVFHINYNNKNKTVNIDKDYMESRNKFVQDEIKKYNPNKPFFVVGYSYQNNADVGGWADNVKSALNNIIAEHDSGFIVRDPTIPVEETTKVPDILAKIKADQNAVLIRNNLQNTLKNISNISGA